MSKGASDVLKETDEKSGSKGKGEASGSKDASEENWSKWTGEVSGSKATCEDNGHLPDEFLRMDG